MCILFYVIYSINAMYPPAIVTFKFMAKRQSVDSDITGLQKPGAAMFSFNSLNRLNHTILKITPMSHREKSFIQRNETGFRLL